MTSPPPHPAHYLSVTMAGMGWDQVTVAIRANLNKSHISRFLKGQVNLNAKLAVALETATGIPSRVWRDWNEMYLRAKQMNL